MDWVLRDRYWEDSLVPRVHQSLFIHPITSLVGITVSIKERLIHTILFEIFALSIFVPLVLIVTNKDASSLTMMSLLISLVAMVWNYIYNWGFDHVYGSNRSSRSIMMRFGHGFGFELGMVAASFPVIMWMLNLDWLAVLIMDLGAVLFFLAYAIIFNWVYDKLRADRQAFWLCFPCLSSSNLFKIRCATTLIYIKQYYG